eukprot:scaffold100363_cov43-Cyclotella_meneghiniana.AAC.1
MGLPTNYDTLMSMKRDMFGLGLCQVILTTLSAGVIAETTKLMLTVVALTMALTPFMEEIGASKGQHHHTMATA